jgi:RNA polymerase sigma factor (sigma-70 family)
MYTFTSVLYPNGSDARLAILLILCHNSLCFITEGLIVPEFREVRFPGVSYRSADTTRTSGLGPLDATQRAEAAGDSRSAEIVTDPVVQIEENLNVLDESEQGSEVRQISSGELEISKSAEPEQQSTLSSKGVDDSPDSKGDQNDALNTSVAERSQARDRVAPVAGDLAVTHDDHTKSLDDVTDEHTTDVERPRLIQKEQEPSKEALADAPDIEGSWEETPIAVEVNRDEDINREEDEGRGDIQNDEENSTDLAVELLTDTDEDIDRTQIDIGEATIGDVDVADAFRYGTAIELFNVRAKGVSLLNEEQREEATRIIRRGLDARLALEASVYVTSQMAKGLTDDQIQLALAQEEKEAKVAGRDDEDAEERRRVISNRLKGVALYGKARQSRGLDEHELVAQLEEEQRIGMEARESFVLANGKLIFYTLEHKLPAAYARLLRKDDLFRAGLDGLHQAIDGFDPAKGVKFSTYAVRVMVSTVIRRTFQEAFDFPVPELSGMRMLKIEAARHKFWYNNKREATPEELAPMVDLSPEIVTNLIPLADRVLRTTRLDAPGQRAYSDSSSYVDREQRGVEDVAIDKVQTVEVVSALREALGQFTAEERQAFIWSIGLVDKPVTAKEIARRQGISRYDIPKTLDKIRETLRHDPALLRLYNLPHDVQGDE